jgi:hypothetical protein
MYFFKTTRDDGRPLWKVIYDDLVGKLNTGEIKIGDTLSHDSLRGLLTEEEQAGYTQAVLRAAKELRKKIQAQPAGCPWCRLSTHRRRRTRQTGSEPLQTRTPKSEQGAGNRAPHRSLNHEPRRPELGRPSRERNGCPGNNRRATRRKADLIGAANGGFENIRNQILAPAPSNRVRVGGYQGPTRRN